MPRITGVDDHLRRLRSMYGPETVRQIGAALLTAGEIVEAEAAQLITAGAVSGKAHVPSRPGEAPNANFHGLDRSIETVKVEPLKVEVSANAPYASALEFGTSKMAERPYMRPAAAKARPQVAELVKAAVTKIIRGGKVVP